MTPVHSTLLSLLAATAAAGTCAAQEPLPPAYPERDVLSPFREPTDVYAPPDELFRQLQLMQRISESGRAEVSYVDGQEVVADPTWRAARERVREIGIDAGQLAHLIRLHRNAEQRDIAFYGAFFVDNVDYAMDLVSHIPGEPVRRTREKAMQRAIPFLKEHLSRTFGDLDQDQKQALIDAIPEIGSPAARAQGIRRAPQDDDKLYALRLVPFFQMLDLEDPVDQAQALWFLKEVFRIRPDLANFWVEPALPRIRSLLFSGDEAVRDEAIGIYRAIGAADLPEPPDVSDRDAMERWLDRAARHMFPPIRNINDAIVQLFPSEDRDAIANAGREALVNSSIGDPYRGQREDGSYFSGFQISYVPEALEPLAVPAKATITTINGNPISSGKDVLDVVGRLLKGRPRPTRLFVEYVLDKKDFAIEYRIM